MQACGEVAACGSNGAGGRGGGRGARVARQGVATGWVTWHGTFMQE
jgi:hypothetical protein